MEPCVRLSLLVLVMGSILGLGAGRDLSECACGAQAPGDILIGLLMPCHSKVEALQNRTRADALRCTEFDLVPFMRSLATIYTIEEVNRQSFLPGVRLGYVLCDTCSAATKALMCVEHMLAINGSLQVQCNYTEHRPNVKCIIGARYSEVSIAVAKLMSVYMVPQVSCTSSTPSLSDKKRYPAFLRTIPSDVHQTQALAKLMAHFKWEWIGVVYGDDEYGKSALQSFLLDAEKERVCVAYQEVMHHYLDHENNPQRIKDVAQRIRSFSKAQVVLLILKPELVEMLFNEMIRTNTNRTWIASDIWSMNRLVAHMDNINEVGDIFGFTFVTGRIEGFEEYLGQLRPSPGGFNRYIEEYKNLRFGCTQELREYNQCKAKQPPVPCDKPDSLKLKNESACSIPDPQKADDNFLPRVLDTTEAYSEKVAVWAIAHALKELLQCNETYCPGEKNFPPWKLLEILKNVNFTLENNERFFFDKSGDTEDGYDLIVWEKNGKKRSLMVRGRFHALDQQMHVDESQIKWLSNMVPKSRCSESCRAGSFKKVSNVSCCYNCTLCPEGTYTDSADQHDCKKCRNRTWCLKGATFCQPREESYLRWSDPHPVALVASAAFGVLLLFVVLIVFLVHRDSAAMKRAEVKMSCVMMAGLAVSFGGVVCFMGKPNVHLCRARQIMFGLGFTLCVSCILVKAFRTFLAFLPFGLHLHRRLNSLYRPPVIVSVLTAIQGIICVFWLIFDSPDVKSFPQGMEILLQCTEGKLVYPEKIGFGCMHSYLALLAFAGFLLAFKGRKVPQEFSETGYIIFSMLIYLFVWVCFIPIYIIRSDQGSIVQASAILVSNYGIIFCHFLPKCYEALCGSQGNTLDNILRRWHLTFGHSTDGIGHTADGEFDQTSFDSGVFPDVPGLYPASETINAPPLDVITNPHLRRRLRSQSF